MTSALRRLTKQKFNEMELNWMSLAESPEQRAQQRKQFHEVAQQWAVWWESEGKSLVDDPAYAAVNLPALVETAPSLAGRQQPPSGPGVRLLEGSEGWIVESVNQSKTRCFVDLDTRREGGWPAELATVEDIGVDGPEVLAWARARGSTSRASAPRRRARRSRCIV